MVNDHITSLFYVNMFNYSHNHQNIKDNKTEQSKFWYRNTTNHLVKFQKKNIPFDSGLRFLCDRFASLIYLRDQDTLVT